MAFWNTLTHDIVEKARGCHGGVVGAIESGEAKDTPTIYRLQWIEESRIKERDEGALPRSACY